MLFVGDDWAEAHHDIELVGETGRVLVRRRLPEGIEGISALHALVADHLGDDDEPEDVIVGIETDRGPWVQALLVAGYTVYAINPLQAARYRERHGTSGAQRDPGDAHVLAELVRTDRAHEPARLPDICAKARQCRHCGQAVASALPSRRTPWPTWWSRTAGTPTSTSGDSAAHR